MRFSLALLLAAAIAVALPVAVVVERGRDDPAASSTGAVTLVGDSLNVGIEPYLEDALPGWRIDTHDQVGRTTDEGVDRLRELDGKLAPVVVISLGTNDADGSETAFAALVDEALALAGPGRCVVWATIVRDGIERTEFDRVLEEVRSAHPNLRLVEWASMVADDDALLAADRVHATPAGYARRAEETARAVRACL